MARLTVVVPDEVDSEFRKAVSEAKGMRKGNLGEAVTEALRLWIAHTRGV